MSVHLNTYCDTKILTVVRIFYIQVSFVFVAYDTQLSLPHNKRVCLQYLTVFDCFTFCQIEAYFKLTFLACKLKYFFQMYTTSL